MGVDPKRLEELFGELFELVSPEDAARAWCSYQTREHPRSEKALDDPDWWAVELMFNLAYSEEEARLGEMLSLVVECCRERRSACYCGRRSSEDFIKDDEEPVEWVEARAAESKKFRKALANVWVRDYVSAANFARLEQAAGVPLR